MSKAPDRGSIAKAMGDAAWVATHGAREERSGRFMEGKPVIATTPKKSNAAS